MLILSRYRREVIRIGDDIVITVVDILKDKVRIGIDAPKHVPVNREEVWRAIQQEVADRVADRAGTEVKGDGDPLADRLADDLSEALADLADARANLADALADIDDPTYPICRECGRVAPQLAADGTCAACSTGRAR